MKTRDATKTTLKFKGHDYIIWFETVTPDRAKELLATNEGKNRRRRETRVERYSADMTSGKWRITGETIRLNAKGELLNGQHRLAAVIKANMPVDMLFVSGIGEETMLVQDTGLPTSNDDWMPIEHASSTVCVVRAVLRIVDPNLYTTASRDELLTANQIIGAEHVAWAIGASKGNSRTISRRAPVRAALALIHKLNPERAELFMNRLNSYDFPGGTIEALLHRAFTAAYKKRSHTEECAVALRACVAALRDDQLARLYEIGPDDLVWLVKATGLDALAGIRAEKAA